MKKIILTITILLIGFLISNMTNAQIKQFFDNALLKSKDRLSRGVDPYLTLEIMVMSPGNNQNSSVTSCLAQEDGVNNANWYVAYGEASFSVMTDSNGKFTLRNNPGFLTNGASSCSGDIIYWFSDRKWNNQDITNLTSLSEKLKYNPVGIFSNSKRENGKINYNYQIAIMNPRKSSTPSEELNLFDKWNWNITKCTIVGDMLYGEINNGKYTFSISYGATSKKPTQDR